MSNLITVPEPERRPELDPGKEGDVPESPEAVEKARKAAREALESSGKDGNNKNITDALKILNDLSKASGESLIENLRKNLSPDEASKAEEQLKILKGKIDNALNANELPEATKKQGENKPGSDTGDKEYEPLKKYLKKLLENYVETLGKIKPDLRDKINSLKIELKNDKTFEENLKELNDKFKELDNSLTDAERKKFQDNLDKAFLKSLKKGGIPDISESKPRSSLSDILKVILKLLMFFSTLGGLLYFLLDYMNTHSGCTLYSQKTDNSPVLRQPIKCFINTTDNKVSNFTSLQCNKDICKLDIEESCNETICDKLQDSSNNDQHPNPIDCGHPKCQNEDSFKAPFSFYKMTIYGPWDVFTDLGNDIVAGTENQANWLWDLIKNILMWGGIGFAIIIGILIIYKVIEHFLNKSSESVSEIKIQTTPETKLAKTAFGNRNILGNLSKYRNYGYMGRCNYKYPV